MREVVQSTNRTIMVFMVASSDHVTGLASLTLTITASKAGGAFASISPTVTDRGNGWYSVALTSSHLDTLGDFALHITGTSADPADILMTVVAYDPFNAVSLGLSRIDAAISTRSTYAGGAVASVTAPVSVTGSVTLDLDQVLNAPRVMTGVTSFKLNDALNAAVASRYWPEEVTGTAGLDTGTYVLYSYDGTTVLLSFTTDLDADGNPTARRTA